MHDTEQGHNNPIKGVVVEWDTIAIAISTSNYKLLHMQWNIIFLFGLEHRFESCSAT